MSESQPKRANHRVLAPGAEPIAPRSEDAAKEPIFESPAWLLPLALLIVAIIAVPLQLLADNGLPRFRLLEAELREVQQQNEVLSREVRDAQREVQSLIDDPVAIERVARDELGMIREGEIVFQFDL